MTLILNIRNKDKDWSVLLHVCCIICQKADCRKLFQANGVARPRAARREAERAVRAQEQARGLEPQAAVQPLHKGLDLGAQGATHQCTFLFFFRRTALTVRIPWGKPTLYELLQTALK